MLRSSRLLRSLSGVCRTGSRAFAAEAAPQEESVLHKVLSAQLSDIRAAGTYKTELELVSPQGPAVSLAGVEGEVLNFCAPLQARTKARTEHTARHAKGVTVKRCCRWTCSQRHCRLSIACCEGPARSTSLVLAAIQDGIRRCWVENFANSSLLAGWPACISYSEPPVLQASKC